VLSISDVWARAGGGGGHSSGGGGYHGGGGGGGGGFGLGFIIGILISHPILALIVIILVVVFNFYGRNAADGGNIQSGGGDYTPPSSPVASFPEGLDAKKVQTSFIEIQDAWQKKDLKVVRKWISDGVYQRYTAQFEMMNKLNQVNRLSNIRVNGIAVAKTARDGAYQTADVAISFTMNDEFKSDKYPQFNESFYDDSDVEYWTFIKRSDAKAGKNLYDNNNCPNCGAPFETKMGEISRCSGCGTLTNNAAYDWVLSEITQQDDYTGDDSMTQNEQLHQLVKNDKQFAVQRMEDIASNVFMQIMEVMTDDKVKKLSRFADKATADKILEIKKQSGSFVFDRLYLNDVSLIDFTTDSEKLNLVFSLIATYQRIQVSGTNLRLIDGDMTTHPFSIILSKNLKALQTPAKETVYSYECASCGAPYNDTTDDTCTYCGEPVIDLNKNWVLTDFRME
jgi:predicted lipid-binding transport protein (Tim44 family)/DNA-directed RNA polymerase subunit RPC12/RpoP